MKRFFYLISVMFFVSILCTSCEKDKQLIDNTCNVTNPAEELNWLKSSITEIEQSNQELSKHAYYMVAKYKGETVFYYGNCHPAINYVSHVINCKGDTLGAISDLDDELTDVNLLWKPEESECNFNK